MGLRPVIDEGPPTRRGDPRPWVAGAVAEAVVAGIALRAWAVAARISPTDSDEAVVGLIAMHLLRGDVELMYWGQTYGGTGEAVLAAVVFAVTGPSVLATKVLIAALAVVASVLVWRIGLRTVGRPGAAVAGALFWVWPAFFVFYSTKIGIYYGALVLSLVVVLLVVRLRDGEVGWWWSPAVGLAAGAAFWSNPQALYLLVPVVVVLAPALVRRWRPVLAAVPFAVVGALPWVVWNAGHRWQSLHVPPFERHQPYLQRVGGTLPQLPLLTGLRTVGTEHWISLPLAVVVLGAGALAFVVAVARRPPQWGWLCWAALLVPFVYAVPPQSVYLAGAGPRYLLGLVPLLALLSGRAVAWSARRIHPGLVVAAVVAAVAVTVAGLADMHEHNVGWYPGAPDALVPADFDDLLSLFDERGIAFAYADYWVAFRATFEAGEDTIVAPVQSNLDRYPPYSRAVAASPAPAFVALSASSVPTRLRARLDTLGIAHQTWQRGDFVVVQPAAPVDRDAVRASFMFVP